MKLKLFLTCLILTVSGLKAQNYQLQFKCSDEDSLAIDDVASKIIGNDSSDFVLNKYSYSLKPGTYTLVLYKFGYHEKRVMLVINNNISPTIVLQAKPIEQSNFIVKATRVQQNNAFAYTNVTAR